MDKSIVLLIGLAVVTSGCLSSDSNRPKRSDYNDRNHARSTKFDISTESDTQQTVDSLSTIYYSHDITKNDKNSVSKEIALNVLALSQDLLKRKLESLSESKYEVLSPISITSALQLAFLGARGSTYDELKKLLIKNSDVVEVHRQFGEIIYDLQTNQANQNREVVNWRKNAKNNYIQKYMRTQSAEPNLDEHKIEVANAIFIQTTTSIRREYENVVKSVYKSKIQQLNFQSEPRQSAQTINDWVKEKTHGKIKEIVPQVLNPNTKAVLANALYFNAEWQESFIQGATMKKNFYPDGRHSNKSLLVNLMAHGGQFPHFFDEETNSDILGFPYKQNSTTMYVILPRDSSTERVKKVQGDLTASKIDSIIDQMTMKTCVALFPKMHLTSSHYLKPELEKMGLKSLFSPSQSDLSLMTESRQNSPLIYPSENNIFNREKRSAVSYKAPSEDNARKPLDFKDFLVNKRIVKSDGGDKKKKRSKRSDIDAVQELENLRTSAGYRNPGLFADEVIHKVDLNINEKGTEGGSATAITLNRSGPQVTFRVDTPFIFLIRHDPTKIPLFYGAVFEPPVKDEQRKHHNDRHRNH